MRLSVETNLIRDTTARSVFHSFQRVPFGASDALFKATMIETHVDEIQIDEYVAGILNEKERRQVEQHAYQCTECLRSLMVSALSLRVNERIRKFLLEEDPEKAVLV